VNIDTILTRPIGRDTLINNTPIPYYEQHTYSQMSVDSGFYDIPHCSKARLITR